MKRKKGKLLLVVCLIFVAVLLFLMSPIFSIDKITLNGNERFSESEILNIAGIKPGMNIFRVKYNNSQKKLLSNTFIKYAEIVTILPDKLEIEIIERKICGYVPYMGTYLYIDQNGFVLDNQRELDIPCPIVTGLKFQEFSVGEKLIVENKNSFDIVTAMSKLMINYDFLDQVDELNISNPDDIHLFVGNVDISFGSIDYADKKIRTAIEIMKTIPEGDKGILHIEDTDMTPYFTYTL